MTKRKYERIIIRTHLNKLLTRPRVEHINKLESILILYLY